LALQVAFKFLLLGGTVLLALVWFDTDPYGLTLGMSVVFISICLAGLAELRLLTAANTESTDA